MHLKISWWIELSRFFYFVIRAGIAVQVLMLNSMRLLNKKDSWPYLRKCRLQKCLWICNSISRYNTLDNENTLDIITIKIISQWDRDKELESLFGMEFKGGRRFSLERNKGISVMSFPAYCLRKYTCLPCPLTRNVFIPLCYSFKSYYYILLSINPRNILCSKMYSKYQDSILNFPFALF